MSASVASLPHWLAGCRNCIKSNRAVMTWSVDALGSFNTLNAGFGVPSGKIAAKSS